MKLHRAEATMKRYVQKTRELTEKELHFAEAIVNKEMRSKIVMSQWTNYFLAVSDQVTLDPITYAFSRFCLNICLCYADVSVAYFIRASIHKQMIAFVNFDSELVSGPALMALSHLSLHHPDIRSEITAGGVLPVLLRLMNSSQSIPILTQICKLCASLSLYFPNKPLLVSNGQIYREMLEH